ncbi:hypothetical protein DFW101_3551 [Solidesulfovibrio carbinoliphilus subsp. oakridgensis]|uniref:Uncharacterized protein n=1 Tax=Solidesulfovibrio carbinoliphilus subsp. oakridgensis TaxID=694327 RepID=G7QCA1_9BACT|nr:hypothetical protein [Solidesulfovibrio carbinoliphilus]EHJ49547.1 hypothetical protein DFW101_3551 [Solidesulfovibrio carbinoliphilus subsp. oakridgensis]
MSNDRCGQCAEWGSVYQGRRDIDGTWLKCCLAACRIVREDEEACDKFTPAPARKVPRG